MWEITNDTGTIHSGTEEEMKIAFQIMTEPLNEVEDNLQLTTEQACSLADEYICPWLGDLKLVQIHNIYK